MSKMRVKKDDELFVEFNPPRTGRVAVVPEKKFNKNHGKNNTVDFVDAQQKSDRGGPRDDPTRNRGEIRRFVVLVARWRQVEQHVLDDRMPFKL